MEEQKVPTQDQEAPQALSPAESQPATDQDERLKAYIKQADELLNIEEITVVYKGVKQPQTPAQVTVELSALRNLTKMIEGRIAALEHDWSIILEKQRIVRSLVEAEERKLKA